MANHPLVLTDYVLQVDLDLSQLSAVFKADIILGTRTLSVQSDGKWQDVVCYSSSCSISREGKVGLDRTKPASISMISYGTRFAFLVNGTPAYYSAVDEKSNTAALRLDIASNRQSALANVGSFDNLKIWNLDKVDLSAVVK